MSPGATSPPLQVLYEDNHCLAVVKPAGWLTMGDRTGDVTLLDAAKQYLKEKYAKPGAVFLGVVHRLDRPVSGIVLFARTSKAASRLSAQFRERTVQKTYQAVVESAAVPAQGTLVDQLRKDADRNVVQVERGAAAGGQLARLTFRRLAQWGALTLVEIHLETGRSHQIRVQLASRGWPIVGDRKYGSRRAWRPERIALHAAALTFTHPVTHAVLTLTAPPPAEWSELRRPVGAPPVGEPLRGSFSARKRPRR